MKTRQLFGALLAMSLGASAGWAQAPTQDYKDNVVIVLDSSGSMRGSLGSTGMNKMQGAKAALKEVLKQVPASTQIGLLVFSAVNLRDDWVYPLGPRDDAALMRAIDLPQPGHGTPLGEYIKKGADRLLQERAKQFGYGTYRLLVVTDGEATDGNLTDLYTPEVMARGITVDVIGVGMDRRHTLATKVHSYRAANDPASLKRAIADVFAEVGAKGQDAAADDVFALIAPIPTEMAAAVVDALARTGNYPIGEKAPPPPAPAPAGSRSAASAAPVSSAPVVPAASPTIPSVPARSRPKGFTVLVVLVLAIIVLRILTRMLKGAGR